MPLYYRTTQTSDAELECIETNELLKLDETKSAKTLFNHTYGEGKELIMSTMIYLFYIHKFYNNAAIILFTDENIHQFLFQNYERQIFGSCPPIMILTWYLILVLRSQIMALVRKYSE